MFALLAPTIASHKSCLLSSQSCRLALRSFKTCHLQEDWRGEIHQLSWTPRAFLLKGFLTGEECDHIIAMAMPHMEKSEVADEETGKSVESDVRTSTGTFLETAQDETIAAIEKRVAQVRLTNSAHPAAVGLSLFLQWQLEFRNSVLLVLCPVHSGTACSVTTHAAVLPTLWYTTAASTQQLRTRLQLQPAAYRLQVLQHHRS